MDSDSITFKPVKFYKLNVDNIETIEDIKHVIKMLNIGVLEGSDILKGNEEWFTLDEQ